MGSMRLNVFRYGTELIISPKINSKLGRVWWKRRLGWIWHTRGCSPSQSHLMQKWLDFELFGWKGRIHDDLWHLFVICFSTGELNTSGTSSKLQPIRCRCNSKNCRNFLFWLCIYLCVFSSVGVKLKNVFSVFKYKIMRPLSNLGS